jgi:AraC-like DNA-binding protein
MKKEGGGLMKKTDITQETLCIQKIISVVKGKLDHRKPITVEGRHCDAFIYVIAGSCTYRFDDKIEFHAGEGDVFYLPYRSVYTMFIHTNDYQFIFCDFQFAETEARYGVLYPNQKQKNTDNLFLKLLNKYDSPSVNAKTECMSILYGIYSILQQDAQKIYLGKNKENKASEALRYIDESFNLPEFSISLLADQIGVSEVYIRKLFKAKYGISPSKYLIKVRLDHAKKLIGYPFMTLEECAMQSGFSSLQYFCRLFKKETGISPGKYRNKL